MFWNILLKVLVKFRKIMFQNKSIQFNKLFEIFHKLIEFPLLPQQITLTHFVGDDPNQRARSDKTTGDKLHLS